MLLVPWRYSAQNHQEKNAKYLKNLGAAEMIREENLNPDILGKAIFDIFDGQHLVDLGKQAKGIFPTDGLNKICKHIINELDEEK